MGFKLVLALKVTHEVFHRVVRDDFTAVYNDDSLAYRDDLGDNVCGKDDSSVLPEIFYEISYLNNLVRVKANRRLVENEDIGVADERLRKADSLLIAL